jgi:hypothetical protein
MCRTFVDDKDISLSLADRADFRYGWIFSLKGLKISRIHGEYEFVVLASVKGIGPWTFMDFAGPLADTIAQGNFHLIDDEAHVAGLGNFVAFASQTIAYIIQAMAMVLDEEAT